MRNKRLMRIFVVVIALGLVASACSASSESTSTTLGADKVAPTANKPAPVANQATMPEEYIRVLPFEVSGMQTGDEGWTSPRSITVDEARRVWVCAGSSVSPVNRYSQPSVDKGFNFWLRISKESDGLNIFFPDDSRMEQVYEGEISSWCDRSKGKKLPVVYIGKYDSLTGDAIETP